MWLHMYMYVCVCEVHLKSSNNSNNNCREEHNFAQYFLSQRMCSALERDRERALSRVRERTHLHNAEVLRILGNFITRKELQQKRERVRVRERWRERVSARIRERAEHVRAV